MLVWTLRNDLVGMEAVLSTRSGGGYEASAKSAVRTVSRSSLLLR